MLQVIRTSGVFGQLDSLRRAAQQAQIEKASKGPVDVHLSFTLPTRLREDAGRRAIERPFHVGCIAEAAAGGDEIAHLSYSVLIGRDAFPSNEVARKFHFDYEPAQFRNASEVKPTFHLQMCGKLSEHHGNAGYNTEHIAHLLPHWSQPRVPAQPMSLALILNWLFIEFSSEAVVNRARQDPTWRKLVRSAEREILKPYYARCSGFLSATANDDDSFFSKQIYGEV